MFDLSIGKIAVIAILALFLVGPDKLPQYAAQLGKWVRVVRGMTDDAKRRVASEMGPEFEDVDWASLDPRRYHPRRMLQDAWNSAPGEQPKALPPGGVAESAAPVVEDDREHDLLELAEAREHDAALLRAKTAPKEQPLHLG